MKDNDKPIGLYNDTISEQTSVFVSDYISLLNWIGIIIALLIPIVNLIVLIGMAFVSENKTLNNFAIALLILSTIAILILYFTTGFRGL